MTPRVVKVEASITPGAAAQAARCRSKNPKTVQQCLDEFEEVSYLFSYQIAINSWLLRVV